MRHHRFARLGPVLAVAAAVVLAPQADAAPPDAKPIRYFLHSASGSYQQDAIGTMPFTAPAGSTMSQGKPARPTSATAEQLAGSLAPGLPNMPTFRTPFAGTVRSLCIDLFVRADIRPNMNPPGIDNLLTAYVRWYYGDATSFDWQEVKVMSLRVTGTGVHRLTGYRVARDAPFAVTKDQPMVIIGANTWTYPGWTLFYDSPVHFSSITPNLPEKKCTAAKLPLPKK